MPVLTTLEAEVLGMIRAGYTIAQVANRVALSETEMEFVLRRLAVKLRRPECPAMIGV